MADGALGAHLQKLEEIGYIGCEKSFVGRRPKSTYRLTGEKNQAAEHRPESTHSIEARMVGMDLHFTGFHFTATDLIEF